MVCFRIVLFSAFKRGHFTNKTFSHSRKEFLGIEFLGWHFLGPRTLSVFYLSHFDVKIFWISFLMVTYYIALLTRTIIVSKYLCINEMCWRRNLKTSVQSIPSTPDATKGSLQKMSQNWDTPHFNPKVCLTWLKMHFIHNF